MLHSSKLLIPSINRVVHGALELLAIAPERVRLLAMHGLIAQAQLLVRHPERDDELDEVAYDAGDDDVEDEDVDDSEDLDAHLLEAGASSSIVDAVGQAYVVLVVLGEVEEVA